MVYSISRAETRVLIKTAVVCTLTMTNISSIFAQDANFVTSNVCGISDGDMNVGIRAVEDASCISGGLGCYNFHCRFCKILETPLSTSFLNCSDVGADLPTMAPRIASSGPCEVSSGDAAVGISAFTDEQCLFGGLGCFNDHCRFCKEEVTSQSEAFVSCPVVSTTGSASIMSDDSSSASGTADTVGCTLQPQVGDVEVGISIGTDPTCSAGGLGCINNVCRFCRIRTTFKSATYPDCSFIGINAPQPSDAPQNPANASRTTGSSIVRDDTPTATPSTLATTDSPSSDPTGALTVKTTAPVASASSDISIDSSASSDISIDTPTASATSTDDSNSTDASAATSDSPAVSTLAPVTLNAPRDGSDAPNATSEAPPDSTDAPASSNSASTEAPPDTTEAPTSSNGAFNPTAASGSNDVPSTFTSAPPAITESPSNFTETPPASTENPIDISDTPTASSDSPASNSTTPAPVTEICTVTASVGDAAVGINIVSDPSCVSGGIGCLTNVCRFCKVTTSPQSAAFIDCAHLDIDHSTSDAPDANYSSSDDRDPSTDDADPSDHFSSTDASHAIADDSNTTDKPIATSATPNITTDIKTVTPPSETCSQTASDGDAAVGINIVSDSSCSAGGVGCIDDICRFCKVFQSSESAAFIDCASTTSTSSAAADAIDNDSPSPTEAPADDVTESPIDDATSDVTDGNSMDASADSDQDDVSEAPIEVPTNSTTAPSDASTDLSTESPTHETCTQIVSEGDAAAGINIVTDASCTSGGTGCIDSICRFCKISETPQSAAFVDCSSITNVETAKAATSAETYTQSIAYKADINDLKKGQIGAIVAGCIGAIAAIAIMVLAAKRSLNSNTDSDDEVRDEADSIEMGKRVSPGTVPADDPVTAEAK